MFKLQFPVRDIARWANKYNYDGSDLLPLRFVDGIHARGYLTPEELKAVAHWKSRRSAGHCAKNSPAFVREVTQTALQASDPRLKVEVLTLLNGVDWPTASVLLHFYDRDRWPVIDYRAFWSLGAPPPAGRYSFSLWQAYTECTRELADLAKVSMRTLDRALWTYSRFKQPSGGSA